MTLHSLPVTHPSPRADILSHPLRAFGVTLRRLMEGYRHRRDKALLMSLAPQMLDDIGVSLSEQRGRGTVLRLHPAVIATRLSGPTWGDDKD